jgi:hypothetical protein
MKGDRNTRARFTNEKLGQVERAARRGRKHARVFSRLRQSVSDGLEEEIQALSAIWIGKLQNPCCFSFFHLSRRRREKGMRDVLP